MNLVNPHLCESKRQNGIGGRVAGLTSRKSTPIRRLTKDCSVAEPTSKKSKPTATKRTKKTKKPS